MLLCGITYEKGRQTSHQEYQHLDNLRVQLESTKAMALLKRKELRLRLNSQSDLRWIELVLMQGLGLVPEGQTKVYFSHKDRLN